MATHKAQRHPSEVEGEALQFLAYIHPVLIESNRDPNFMYNMDQTPVQMAMEVEVHHRQGWRAYGESTHLRVRNKACDSGCHSDSFRPPSEIDGGV